MWLLVVMVVVEVVMVGLLWELCGSDNCGGGDCLCKGGSHD